MLTYVDAFTVQLLLANAICKGKWVKSKLKNGIRNSIVATAL